MERPLPALDPYHPRDIRTVSSLELYRAPSLRIQTNSTMSTAEGNKNAAAAAEGLKAILRNNYISDELKQDAARRLREDKPNAEKLSPNDQAEVAKWADLKVRDFAYETAHN